MGKLRQNSKYWPAAACELRRAKSTKKERKRDTQNDRIHKFLFRNISNSIVLLLLFRCASVAFFPALSFLRRHLFFCFSCSFSVCATLNFFLIFLFSFAWIFLYRNWYVCLSNGSKRINHFSKLKAHIRERIERCLFMFIKLTEFSLLLCALNRIHEKSHTRKKSEINLLGARRIVKAARTTFPKLLWCENLSLFFGHLKLLSRCFRCVWLRLFECMWSLTNDDDNNWNCMRFGFCNVRAFIVDFVEQSAESHRSYLVIICMDLENNSYFEKLFWRPLSPRVVSYLQMSLPVVRSENNQRTATLSGYENEDQKCRRHEWLFLHFHIVFDKFLIDLCFSQSRVYVCVWVRLQFDRFRISCLIFVCVWLWLSTRNIFPKIWFADILSPIEQIYRMNRNANGKNKIEK